MYVSVRVVAGAKKESLEVLKDNRLKVYVKEPAERGLANRRVQQLVALHLKLPPSKARLISGHTSPAKLFSVDTEGS